MLREERFRVMAEKLKTIYLPEGTAEASIEVIADQNRSGTVTPLTTTRGPDY